MDIEQEKLLIKQAKSNPEAFGQLFDAYYDKIFNYCLRRLENKQAAEDATGEVFFKALEALPKYKWQGAPFGAWLYRIASNEVINFYRNQNNKSLSLEQMQEASGFDAPGEGSASTVILDQETSEQKYQDFLFIKQRIKTLPDYYQEVLRLRYFEKLPIAEVAAVLDKPEGTVKSLLSRGVDLLQEQVAQKIFNTQLLKSSPVVINEGEK